MKQTVFAFLVYSETKYSWLLETKVLEGDDSVQGLCKHLPANG